MTAPEARVRLAERELMQRVFCSTDDGSAALAVILNRCGYYADDPSVIHPELIAMANWLLWTMGIYGGPDGAGLIAQARNLTRDATTKDLADAIKEDNDA
jgi:hypothetical protein